MSGIAKSNQLLYLGAASAAYDRVFTHYLVAKNITIPVPRHPGDVPIGTLRAIIREMDISIEEFNSL